jgi:hypothetical protein
MDNFKVITKLCMNDFPDDGRAQAETCLELHCQHIKGSFNTGF